MEYQRIKAFLIILIADDENLVRLGLKKVIKDSQLDSVEILEARNGREMVGVCQNTAPDLAFVDIKMPLLDGLEAICAAKEFCPHTLWVMLTGFSEFRFAQNAISLGVKDYLIKPFEPEKIQKILLDAQQHVQKKHMDSNLFLNCRYPICSIRRKPRGTVIISAWRRGSCLRRFIFMKALPPNGIIPIPSIPSSSHSCGNGCPPGDPPKINMLSSACSPALSAWWPVPPAHRPKGSSATWKALPWPLT